MNRWIVALLLAAAFAPLEGRVAADLGIYPDCDERPTSYDELSALAHNSASFGDFLRNIPPDSLQTFTLVRNTNSLQHHLTSAEWPRVLRMSADGKVVLSYVCHPDSQDYGKVELLRFEDNGRSFLASTFGFQTNPPSYRGVRLENYMPELRQRVQENPRACAKCHSTQPQAPNPDLRPLIANYPIWDGHYGRLDDKLVAGSQEYLDFLAFRERIFTESIECYTTLPWPKEFTGDYALYPYHAYAIDPETYRPTKPRNYHIRPNLKFNDALAHLLAQRLARKFEEHEAYHRAKYLFMLEAVGCPDVDFAAELTRLGLPPATLTAAHEKLFLMHPIGLESQSSILYIVGRSFGIEDADWNLNFNQSNDPSFYTGIAGLERDISIAELTQGQILMDIAKELPQVLQWTETTRGVSKNFAPQNFSCIDDLGGQVVIKEGEPSGENKKKFCALMVDRLHENRGGPAIPPLPALARAQLSAPAANALLTDLRTAFGPARPLQIAAGKEIAHGLCASCHSLYSGMLPDAYAFFDSREALVDELRADPVFIFQALYYLQSGRMPKDHSIAPADVEAVEAYLLDAAEQAKHL